jgi:hypothetical protein
MPDYQLGKIYKIVDNTTNEIYIGSTCQKYLSTRLQGHLTKYKQYKNGKCGYTTSFKIFENENYDIVLLQNYPCNNKYELESKEREYIESLDCINKVIPTISIEERKDYQKEYYQNNKDKINEKGKEYYKNNKDRLSEKIKCEICNSMVSRMHLLRHKKSMKCLKNVCLI